LGEGKLFVAPTEAGEELGKETFRGDPKLSASGEEKILEKEVG